MTITTTTSAAITTENETCGVGAIATPELLV